MPFGAAGFCAGVGVLRNQLTSYDRHYRYSLLDPNLYGPGWAGYQTN